MATSESSTRDFFTKHAKGYSNSPSFARGSDLAALLTALKPRETDVALDVATGTGFTALFLAPHLRKVVGIDITDGMLRQARRIAKEYHTKNAFFRRGNAMALGYPASSFDIVTTRRAAHHFDDVPAFLREAKRVLRKSGRLGIVDMSPPPGAEDFTNGIEKLRDASHIWAFSPRDWRAMLNDTGFSISSLSILGEPITLEDWLYPVEGGGREEAAVREAWRSAPAKTRRLLKAHIHDGAIQGWTKDRIVIVASPKTP